MSLLTQEPQLSSRHDFLASFLESCKKVDLDGTAWFDFHFTYGYVFKGPQYLLLGGPGEMYGQPDDCWVVWWAESTCRYLAIRKFLHLMPHHRPRIAWCRYLKGRREVKFFSTDRLLRLTDEQPL